MQLSREGSFARWVSLGVPLLLSGGLLVVVGLHMGASHLPIEELIVPVTTFVGIQVVFFVCAFWAGRLARNQNQYAPIVALSAGYCWATGILVFHYGSKWRLLRADSRDYVPFTILILISTLVIAALIRFGGTVPPKN